MPASRLVFETQRDVRYRLEAHTAGQGKKKSTRFNRVLLISMREVWRVGGRGLLSQVLAHDGARRVAHTLLGLVGAANCAGFSGKGSGLCVQEKHGDHDSTLLRCRNKKF